MACVYFSPVTLKYPWCNTVSPSKMWGLFVDTQKGRRQKVYHGLDWNCQCLHHSQTKENRCRQQCTFQQDSFHVSNFILMLREAYLIFVSGNIHISVQVDMPNQIQMPSSGSKAVKISSRARLF